MTAKYKDVGEIQVELKDGVIRGATIPFTVSPTNFAITSVTDSADVANPAARAMVVLTSIRLRAKAIIRTVCPLSRSYRLERTRQ